MDGLNAIDGLLLSIDREEKGSKDKGPASAIRLGFSDMSRKGRQIFCRDERKRLSK
jgi:hypothetical protein